MDSLRANDVERVYFVTGGAALPITDGAMTNGRDIRFIQAITEQGAGFMASGDARASGKGKVGVVNTTSGPGAINLLNAVADAWLDRVRLVAITGQVSTAVMGTEAFQEAKVTEMAKHIAKAAFLITDTNDIPRTMNEAFRIAQSGRPGSVLVDLPKDVALGEFTGKFERPEPVKEASVKFDDLTVKAVADVIRRARRPLLWLGHGAMDASKELQAIVELEDIPFVTTLLGKGVISEKHKRSLGMGGMHGSVWANMSLVKADVVVNFGARNDDRFIGRKEDFCRDAFKVHVDIDPEQLGKIIKPDIGVEADAKTFAAALLDELRLNGSGQPTERQEWNTYLDRYRQTHPLSYESGDGLNVLQVIRAVYKYTGGKATAVTDVGQTQMWGGQEWMAEEPNTWLSSGGLGVMGSGMPFALGAQFAKPNEQVVAFLGDGGAGMSYPELTTAVNNKLPVVLFVLNNGVLGMVDQWQGIYHGGRKIGVNLSGGPDIVKLAEAYHATGVLIDSPANLQSGIEKAFSVDDGPVVVDVRVQPGNVSPMVGPGSSLAEMVVETPSGEWVLARPS